MSSPPAATELAYRLRGLRMGGAVLHLGAHPDDEDSGTLAYLSRGRGIRAVYWSATRGEGGQNRRGSETGEALGIIRTWETLAAREIDGAEALYGPFYDFGYSKSGDDALARWGRDAVVREIVRAIRQVQPQIVISRWAGGESDGHGHHQAIGLVAEEALAAAADPGYAPELAPGLPPWQALKLYRSLGPDWQPGEGVITGVVDPAYDDEGHLRIDAGEVDSLRGLTYQEQADMARNCHRSQGMGQVPAPGPYYYYYRLDRSLTPGGAGDLGFLDGLDAGLAGPAEQVGASTAVRDLLAEARRHAEAAAAALRPGVAEEAGVAVLGGLDALRRVPGALDAADLEPTARAALERYVARKEREFEDAAAACFGLRLECLLDRAHTSPGRTVHATVRAWGGERWGVGVASARLELPDGWESRDVDAERAGDGSPTLGPAQRTYEIIVPGLAPFSTPYWLREPRGRFRYEWPSDGPLGLPLDEPLVGAVLDVEVEGRRISIRAEGVHQSPLIGGFRRLPLSVLPPIALAPQSRRELIPAAPEDVTLELPVTVRTLAVPEEATLTVETPRRWLVAPTSLDLRFERDGETGTRRFEVTIPEGAEPADYELRYRAEAGGKEYAVDVEPVRLAAASSVDPVDERSCVAEAFLIRPGAVNVRVIEADFIRTLRYGYVPGVQEDILRALTRFDLDLTVLEDEELSYGDLSAYHTIVVGPNAYLTRGGVRANARRLLEYASGGGTLVVQYQGYGYEAPGLAPYPFRYRRPHDRVTAFDAPVSVKAEGHPLLTVPNEIGAEEWEDWVLDRGLYFWGTWDRRYTPLLACHDPGEEPKEGGLLVAGHGRGTYVYVAYSLFRQVAAGVPGGVRLFANLLGLGEARVRERMERLRGVDLFSEMPESQRYEAARIMSERWIEDGGYLCREGDRGRELFLLVEGEIEAIKGGNTFHVATPGEAVGELAVLADLPRSASLRARGDARVLVMGGKDFRQHLRTDPELSERLIGYLVRKLAPQG